MSNETNEDDSANGEQSINYDAIENHIDDAQEALEQVEEGIPDRFRSDLDDIEDRLEDVEDSLDDAQDGEGANPLGAVPATLNYLQHATDRLAEQDEIPDDALGQFQTALESSEDAVEFVDIERTRWFALVDGVPGLHDEPTPTAGELIQQSKGEDANVDRFTLRAYTSAADDEPDEMYTRDSQEADLTAYRHYRTEADKDGGPV